MDYREYAYDRWLRRPNRPSESTCDECGTNLIEDCLVCGAPMCCPKCCAETTAALRASGVEEGK